MVNQGNITDWRLPDVWPAPAKLNLMLRIVGRRDDGYHLLQSVFQFLDFGDSLQFEVNDTGEVRRASDLTGVAGDEDLTVRAARLLQKESGCRQGVDIRVEKRTPMGGGLGGGSSDAATTLVALNHLWELKLSDDELAALGVRLGADVPVFVRGFAAWAEGVGEQLQPIELPESLFLVITPNCHVDTGEVFSAPELTRNAARKTIADFFSGEFGNTCEQVVRNRYPAVDEAMRWLSSYGEARMTGTGASIFTVFDDRERAQQVYKLAADRYRVFLARGRNLSPLREKLALM